ncbi:VOC family protein [Saccharospirillum mangrovi]|uniref:VOC family protein n=1 Tax=Saccharospirillum mangrovi TaxID=2161747 RepID=UPI000D3A6703|nr:VOC family protein [Saccharospirillum mangrovi]
MPQHESIHYLEFPASNFAATQTFFETVFDWKFVSYGPEYLAFTGGGMEGGFYHDSKRARSDEGSALVIFYSDELADTQAKIEAAGGEILQAIYEFPGGRRFHFAEPSGNEFAVWSER